MSVAVILCLTLMWSDRMHRSSHVLHPVCPQHCGLIYYIRLDVLVKRDAMFCIGLSVKKQAQDFTHLGHNIVHARPPGMHITPQRMLLST